MMVKWVKLTHVVVVLYSIENCCKFKHTKHNSTCHLLYACANVPKQPCLMLVTDCWLLVKSFFPLVTGFYTGGVIWKIGKDVFVSRKNSVDGFQPVSLPTEGELGQSSLFCRLARCTNKPRRFYHLQQLSGKM